MSGLPGSSAHEGAAEEEPPDPLRRRVARPGPDGKVIEVLAARRGTTMRANPGAAGASGGGDSVMGFVLSFVVQAIAAIVIDIVIDAAAEGRPWKVKAYRVNRVFARKLHSERLPPGIEPELRMTQLLDELAPGPGADSVS